MTNHDTPLQERRSFLAKFFAVVGGGAALLVPAALGMASFLNPLRQKGQAGGLLQVPLDALPEDGTPMKFSVLADRTDAWNRYPNEAIGAVYLRRVEKQGGKFAVEALQVVCPHAGCSIMYEPGEKGGKFYCPCHGASFDLAGRRLDRISESPRDMDSLETEIIGKEVKVKFQSFAAGTPKKNALA